VLADDDDVKRVVVDDVDVDCVLADVVVVGSGGVEGGSGVIVVVFEVDGSVLLAAGTVPLLESISLSTL